MPKAYSQATCRQACSSRDMLGRLNSEIPWLTVWPQSKQHSEQHQQKHVLFGAVTRSPVLVRGVVLKRDVQQARAGNVEAHRDDVAKHNAGQPSTSLRPQDVKKAAQNTDTPLMYRFTDIESARIVSERGSVAQKYIWCIRQGKLASHAQSSCTRNLLYLAALLQ